MSEKSEGVLPITESDLEWWHNKIVTLDWVFAATYAAGAPHKYSGERSEGITKADFARAARVIHTFGEPQKFFKTTRIYLVHDGWKCWTMDRDHDDVTLINRGRADHVYGVQNMPRTKSEFRSGYDGIATYWDRELTATGEEQPGFARIVDEVTGGYRKCRTLDIGAGTGLTLDLGLTEAPCLTVIEPSQAMLNELVRKHPLGGSASYLSREDWESIMRHARGRIVLSVYAEGESPDTADLTSQQLADAGARLREFATRHEGRIERVGRFDTVTVGRSHS